MKIIQIIITILTFLIVTPSHANYPIAEDEYVNDYANIMDYDGRSELRQTLHDVEYYSGIEITVLTINNYREYSSSSFETFATALFNDWAIGNMPQNNGVLVLVSIDNKKVRIELGAGYPDHYDEIMQTIIDKQMLPYFKMGNYSLAVNQGVNSIIEAVTEPVSFLEWYKWYILAGIGAVISLIVALKIDREENPGFFLLLIGLAGLLILWIFRRLEDGHRSDGFGGGHSTGGGASGSWGGDSDGGSD